MARWFAARALALIASVALAAGVRRGDYAPRIAPEATSAPEAAIAQGLTYLRGHPSDLSALIVLDYLQRKYALPADLAFEATHTEHRDDRRLSVWGRFVGRDQRPDEAALGALTAGAGHELGIEEVVMHALYCDKFALPTVYGKLLQQLAERGDYELTHAGLAVKLAHDLGCAIPGLDSAAFAAQLTRWTRALVQRAPDDRRFEPLDVRYEGLAILEDFLADRDALRGEINRLLAEQQPDGGWKPSADQPSAPHPTVMAVWALLAWTRPGATEITFARR